MRIKVLKFGGTSVGTAEHRLAAARHVVQCREQGCSPVVVVSAIGRAGAPYATDTLLNELRGVDPSVPPDPRDLDLMVACGEIISTVIFAQTLRSLGYQATALSGGQAGIITDEVFGDARIASINPYYAISSLRQGKIPVVAGFQGVTDPGTGRHGAITTLGRGGSDTTASALGAALRAEAVEIYTDVPGVMTADPRVCPGAATLPRVSYEEIAEMAHQGAKVLHPRAAEIAMDYGIPLWVKGTGMADEGTLVAGSAADLPHRVTGITSAARIAYLTLRVAHPEDRRRLELELFRILARVRVSFYLIGSSTESIGFAVPRESLALVTDLLDGLVVPAEREGDAPRLYVLRAGETGTQSAVQQDLLAGAGNLGSVVPAPLAVADTCAIVSVIATRMWETPGMAVAALETLQEAGVPVLQMADAPLSLSCLIHENGLERAVQALHARFILREQEEGTGALKY
ncbi:MAG: aspartate kinase [Armatimonadetes bacterium]|nr:aspartate kinase [Armatimonadota bacterium]